MRSPPHRLLAAALVTCLLPGYAALTGETAREHLDDAAITAAVVTKLAAERISTLTRIGVDTVQGTVHLTGIVQTAALRERAGEIARRVQGVRGVVNNLRVQATPS